MARRDAGRAAKTLRQGYRSAAKAGNWQLCKQIAERMRGLDADGAEVMYALGYAKERLGELEEARKAYDVVLRINKGHEKARARLRGLARW